MPPMPVPKGANRSAASRKARTSGGVTGKGTTRRRTAEGSKAVAHDPEFKARTEIERPGAEMGGEEAGIGDLDPPALAGEAGKLVVLRMRTSRLTEVQRPDW